MSNFVKCLSKRIFWSIVFLKTFLLVWSVWSLSYVVWTFFILVILGVFTKLRVCSFNFEVACVGRVSWGVYPTIREGARALSWLMLCINLPVSLGEQVFVITDNSI